MPYVLGLDLGTSSLKGILVNQTGVVVQEASASYDLISPQAGYNEQDPKKWLQAVDEIFAILRENCSDFSSELAGISFSGQMHSLVVLNDEMQPLRNAILWNDVRTTEECQTIMAQAGDRLLAINKNVALEGFTLPKMLWLQKNEPDTWQKTAHFLLPKDYLRYYLTGQINMDYSDAAGTLLLDVAKKEWSKELAEQFGIPAKIFPTLVDSDEKVGYLSETIKEKYGFTKDVAVFAGGADNACAALGAGIIRSGMGLASIGTSGVLLAYEDQVKDYAGKLHFFNHTKKDSYYAMGVTLAAGYSLDWYRKNFAEHLSYEALLAEAESVTSAGARGLLFTPYLNGERTPYTDSEIRGSFIGVDAGHKRAHFTRAVLEGITFSLKDSQMLMKEYAGNEFEEIVSVGGGAKSALWLQIQADIFNTTIITLKNDQGPAMGAAILAAVGVGWYADIASCVADFVKYDKKIEPNVQNVVLYQKMYAIYTTIYEQTKNICHSLQFAR